MLTSLQVQVKLLTAFTLPFLHIPKPLSLPQTHTSRTCLQATISNIECASVSMAGMDPDSPGKVNQDAVFHSGSATAPKTGRFVYGGVLDGHGKKGHVLNDFLGSNIPNILQEKLDAYGDGNQTSIQEILIETFESAHLAARMDESVPAGRSGTTCVVTVIDTESGMIFTGNVGDSRAILAVKDSDDSDSEWRVMPLSTETTTEREDERARIERNEGRIDSGGNVW
jgi:serine/threonine protein phosphatase PrpC